VRFKSVCENFVNEDVGTRKGKRLDGVLLGGIYDWAGKTKKRPFPSET
jgi:hypothetical protein